MVLILVDKLLTTHTCKLTALLATAASAAFLARAARGPGRHDVTLAGVTTVPARQEAAQPQEVMSLHPFWQSPLLRLHLLDDAAGALLGKLCVKLKQHLRHELSLFRCEAGQGCLLLQLGDLLGLVGLVQQLHGCADVLAELSGHVLLAWTLHTHTRGKMLEPCSLDCCYNI